MVPSNLGVDGAVAELRQVALDERQFTPANAARRYAFPGAASITGLPFTLRDAPR